MLQQEPIVENVNTVWRLEHLHVLNYTLYNHLVYFYHIIQPIVLKYVAQLPYIIGYMQFKVIQ